MKLHLPALDFIAEELEAVPDVNNPRLVRVCWALLACSLRCAASYPLLIRQASVLLSSFLQIHLAMETLAVQLTPPLAGCVEDFTSEGVGSAGRTK